MSYLFIHEIKLQIKIDNLQAGKKLLHSMLFTSDNLKAVLLPVIQGESAGIPLYLNRVELDLGTISIEEFNQKLTQAFAQYIVREQTVVSMKPLVDVQAPDTKSLGELLNESALDAEQLYHLALHCLSPSKFEGILHESPINQQRLLKILLEHTWQYSEILPASYYNRVTASRLSIAAILYLLSTHKGIDWMSHNYPTPDQLNSWVEAIIRGEISDNQVMQLLTVNYYKSHPSSARSMTSFSLIERWILPLWQKKKVRNVICKQKKGKQEQINSFFNRYVGQQASPIMKKGYRTKNGINGGVDNGINNRIDNGVYNRIDNGVYNRIDNGVYNETNSDTKQSSSMFLAVGKANPDVFQTKYPKTNISASYVSKVGDKPMYHEVDDAGLLLLWPILPRFFTQLKLCNEQAFINEEARWQALNCLTWLVWGMENPLGMKSTLSKLLCGIPLSNTAPCIEPLDELFQSKIDSWLTAIGQQLPNWKKLSLTDIRQLFLQRKGEILMEIPPQINVKPEPYDFLLRDWPWPMTIATLPWLEQPLSLVWSTIE